MKTNKIYDDQLIVVTGAAGFIGSCVVRVLNDMGLQNLLLVDDFGQTTSWKNLVGKRFVDILSRDGLLEWIKGREMEIEAFIHLGACSDTTVADGDYVMANNYRYSIQLAEYALHHGHRFIYASSAATYGDGRQGFSDDHDTIDKLRPINLYAYSKHLFDQWLKRQGLLGDVVGLKYFNIFGPNEAHKGRMASMVYHMVEQIQKTGFVKLFRSSCKEQFADGEQCRDFLYVKDAAKRTVSFLKNDISGIFNVGSGVATTWNQLARAVFTALEKPINVNYIPMPSDLKKGYQNYTCADLTKYKTMLRSAELPFDAPVSVEDAVKDYVQNHLLNDQPW